MREKESEITVPSLEVVDKVSPSVQKKLLKTAELPGAVGISIGSSISARAEKMTWSVDIMK
jgi:hypothetical protein